MSEQPKKSLPMLNQKDSWYAEGLNFECTGCGQCCTGAPGYVWVTETEILLLAEHLNLSLEDFTKRYIRQIGERFSLTENLKTYDCVFLKDKKCQVYSLRPKQCRTFPWWPQNLKSRADWEEAAKHCEGIRMDKPLVSVDTIQQQLSHQLE